MEFDLGRVGEAVDAEGLGEEEDVRRVVEGVLGLSFEVAFGGVDDLAEGVVGQWVYVVSWDIVPGTGIVVAVIVRPVAVVVVVVVIVVVVPRHFELRCVVVYFLNSKRLPASDLRVPMCGFFEYNRGEAVDPASGEESVGDWLSRA